MSEGSEPKRGAAWPALPLAPWRATYATLHMWTQIVGKTRLALAPMENHWWQTTLYVTSRGLTTSPIPVGERSLAADFDFIDHRLHLSTSDGATQALPLEPQSVADFYRDYRAALQALDVDVRFWPVPVEVETAIPFAEDRAHASYDAAAVSRWWRIMVQVDRVLKRFRAGFTGKTSPVHFFWGNFDLAVTRFSGRRAPRHPGGAPHCPDYVMVEAYSHECSSCGFWPGGTGLEEAAFYSYAYPEPVGYPSHPILPRGARYSPGLREFILPYEEVRRAADPEQTLLAFAQSAYAAAADLGDWDRAALERPV